MQGKPVVGIVPYGNGEFDGQGSGHDFYGTVRPPRILLLALSVEYHTQLLRRDFVTGVSCASHGLPCWFAHTPR